MTSEEETKNLMDALIKQVEAQKNLDSMKVFENGVSSTYMNAYDKIYEDQLKNTFPPITVSPNTYQGIPNIGSVTPNSNSPFTYVSPGASLYAEYMVDEVVRKVKEKVKPKYEVTVDWDSIKSVPKGTK